MNLNLSRPRGGRYQITPYSVESSSLRLSSLVMTAFSPSGPPGNRTLTFGVQSRRAPVITSGPGAGLVLTSAQNSSDKPSHFIRTDHCHGRTLKVTALYPHLSTILYLAEPRRFELPLSSVTGKCTSQLCYGSICCRSMGFKLLDGSEPPRPSSCTA